MNRIREEFENEHKTTSHVTLKSAFINGPDTYIAKAEYVFYLEGLVATLRQQQEEVLRSVPEAMLAVETKKIVGVLQEISNNLSLQTTFAQHMVYLLQKNDVRQEAGNDRTGRGSDKKPEFLRKVME